MGRVVIVDVVARVKTVVIVEVVIVYRRGDTSGGVGESMVMVQALRWWRCQHVVRRVETRMVVVMVWVVVGGVVNA